MLLSLLRVSLPYLLPLLLVIIASCDGVRFWTGVDRVEAVAAGDGQLVVVLRDQLLVYNAEDERYQRSVDLALSLPPDSIGWASVPRQDLVVLWLPVERRLLCMLFHKDAPRPYHISIFLDDTVGRLEVRSSLAAVRRTTNLSECHIMRMDITSADVRAAWLPSDSSDSLLAIEFQTTTSAHGGSLFAVIRLDPSAPEDTIRHVSCGRPRDEYRDVNLIDLWEYDGHLYTVRSGRQSLERRFELEQRTLSSDGTTVRHVSRTPLKCGWQWASVQDAVWMRSSRTLLLSSVRTRGSEDGRNTMDVCSLPAEFLSALVTRPAIDDHGDGDDNDGDDAVAPVPVMWTEMYVPHNGSGRHHLLPLKSEHAVVLQMEGRGSKGRRTLTRVPRSDANTKWSVEVAATPRMAHAVDANKLFVVSARDQNAIDTYRLDACWSLIDATNCSSFFPTTASIWRSDPLNCVFCADSRRPESGNRCNQPVVSQHDCSSISAATTFTEPTPSTLFVPSVSTGRPASNTQSGTKIERAKRSQENGFMLVSTGIVLLAALALLILFRKQVTMFVCTRRRRFVSPSASSLKTKFTSRMGASQSSQEMRVSERANQPVDEDRSKGDAASSLSSPSSSLLVSTSLFGKHSSPLQEEALFGNDLPDLSPEETGKVDSALLEVPTELRLDSTRLHRGGQLLCTGRMGPLYRTILRACSPSEAHLDGEREVVCRVVLDANSLRTLRRRGLFATPRLVHPHVVSLLGVTRCSPTGRAALVFEFVEQGTLHAYLEQNQDALSDSTRSRWASQAAHALRFLHSHNIVHGAFSSEVCLLDLKLDLKVGGLCKWMSSSLDSATTTPTQGDGSMSADVQAFGDLLLELYANREGVLPAELAELHAACTAKHEEDGGDDKSKRPSADELCVRLRSAARCQRHRISTSELPPTVTDSILLEPAPNTVQTSPNNPRQTIAQDGESAI